MPLDGTTLPPPQYDHAPNIPVIERVLNITEANRICIGIVGKEAGQGRVWWGCAQTKYQDYKLVCIIHRINDPRVLRHEIGHCNGWSNNHETEAELKLRAEQEKSQPKTFLFSDWKPLYGTVYKKDTLPWPDNAPVADLNQVLEIAKNRR